MTDADRKVVEALRDMFVSLAKKWPRSNCKGAKKDRERAAALTALLDAADEARRYLALLVEFTEREPYFDSADGLHIRIRAALEGKT